MEPGPFIKVTAVVIGGVVTLSAILGDHHYHTPEQPHWKTTYVSDSGYVESGSGASYHVSGDYRPL